MSANIYLRDLSPFSHARPHHHLGRIISIALVAAGLCLIILPFIPAFIYKYQKFQGVQTTALALENYKKKHIPSENRLVIPEIFVDGQIYEGKNDSTLSRGLWHRPNTSTPDRGGNTVITAHRYKFISGPNTFYNLDKLKIGDKLTVFWNSKEYDYQVIKTRVVPPSDLSVENNSSSPMLTLYTCTPLWTSKNRLVVEAKLL